MKHLHQTTRINADSKGFFGVFLRPEWGWRLVRLTYMKLHLSRVEQEMDAASHRRAAGV